MAIAQAVPYQPTMEQHTLPIAHPAAMGTVMPIVPVPGGGGGGGGGRNKY